MSAVMNHGVDKQLTDNAFQLNKDFFALPTEEKLKLTVDENLRGYTAINVGPVHPCAYALPGWLVFLVCP